MAESSSPLQDVGESIQALGQEIDAAPSQLQRLLKAAIGVWLVGVSVAGVHQVSQSETTEPSAHVFDEPTVIRPGVEIELPHDSAVAGSVTPETTTTTVATTTTTTATTTTTMPPAPATAATAEVPRERSIWWDGKEDPREFIGRYIAKVPTLPQLAQRFGGKFADADKQLAFIDSLAKNIQISLDKYQNFTANQDYQGAFSTENNYGYKIAPQLIVIHWTGHNYEQGIPQYINSEIGLGYRTEFLVDRPALAYQFFEDDRFPAHAKGANLISQGIEIITRKYDVNDPNANTSPVYDYTPDQIEHAIYLAVAFCRRNKLPVDQTTIISHYAVDLLFNSQVYNPETGEAGSIDKWDPPQELISRVIIPLAQQLDAALGPR